MFDHVKFCVTDYAARGNWRGNWGQTPISLGFNDAPLLVGHGELENGLGKIDRNGSSIHVGLFTFDEDLIPTPMKTNAPTSGKKTGEYIPSSKRSRLWRSA